MDSVRRTDVNALWLQEQQARERVPLRKVLDASNPAGLLTKNLIGALVRTYLKLSTLEFRLGRTDSAVELCTVSKPTTIERRTVHTSTFNIHVQSTSTHCGS